MHILIIAEFFPPDFGGASTRAFNVAKGLSLQGCDVTVVCGFPHYPHGKIPEKYHKKFFVVEKIDNINLIRTWVPSIPHTSNFNRLKSHFGFMFSSFFGSLKVKNFDVIIAMNPNLFSFFPSLFCHYIRRREIIRNVDDLWPEVFYDLGVVKSNFLKKILDFLALKSYNIPKMIIPVSEGYVPTLINKYNVSKSKISVIEHGVDTKKFFPQKHTNSKKIIMYSGAINIGYDFDLVLNCAKYLENENIKFIIRGTGDLSELIKKNIQQNSISNVVLDTVLVDSNKLVKILQSADFFILPMSKVVGIDTGLPTKIFEYQALGKPIICVSDNQAGKYIEKTESGLVTNSRDPKILSELILKLVKDEKLSNTLGQNGLDNVQNNLTLNHIGARFLEIIKNLKLT
jgi:glycosyltransferase involved in cell wall biosynthesis